MTDPKNYSEDDFKAIFFDEASLESVDLSRDTFKSNLEASAISARDYTRIYVTTVLPDDITFTVYFGCSYDGNPRVEDEKTFPEDYEKGPVTTASSEAVTRLLWRDGFVPEWINVTVSQEDGVTTFIKLECCGRFSATPSLMYHRAEGRPPFHVLGPALPPEYDHDKKTKFDLYWRKKN